ncbi:flagellar biosynthesis anti-sigma factor FlgM [Kosakonia sp. BYX6]|uniref:Negative regulator of flagellin synthesis n=1 Tax=Kosakonia calanthes TaxID=3139408 RepID=A0ABZ3B8E0_9ENTR
MKAPPISNSTLSLLKQAQKTLDTLPDVDRQKIEAIRAAIDNGKFTVDIDALIDAIREFHQR